MKLKSSDISDHFTSLNLLLVTVNEFAGDQGYDVIKRRTKTSKKKVLRKASLRCDKERDFKSQKFERRDTVIRSSECSFDVIVTLNEEE
jgi:hypothetical protein